MRNVSSEDLARVAAKYLRADQRTLAWLEPGSPANHAEPPMTAAPEDRAGVPAVSAPVTPATVIATPDHAPVLFQSSSLSGTLAIKALLAGRYDCAGCAVDSPAFGLTTLSVAGPANRAEDILAGVTETLLRVTPVAAAAPSSDDPLTRLEEIFASMAGTGPAAGLIAVAVRGDANNDAVARFAGALPQAGAAPGASVTIGADREIILDGAKAQHAVGYAAAAPAADSVPALATRIALYVLSHGYAGRLGVEAISRRGLAYYIDAQVRGGLVTLATGVDPGKVDAFRDLMKAEIARLKTEPPTDAEIAEAKRHLRGRKISAAQSNAEIAEALLQDVLAVGRPESEDEFAARLDKVTRADVLAAVDALQKGAIVTVRGKAVN
jgi:hypothetical protein